LAGVLYEVRASNLPIYIDLGLTPFKFGEEAMIPLSEFPRWTAGAGKRCVVPKKMRLKGGS